MNAGSRVIALQCVEGNIVKSFGEGVYAGDFIHPGLGFENPRIDLDNGDTVWGCECWWGPIDRLKAKYADKQWETVRIVREKGN